ncbi:hypothetical protein ABPG73_017896 [Tetrahymena malaccensis]
MERIDDSQKDFSLPGNRKFISQQYLSRKVDINEKDYQSRKSFNLTVNARSQHNQQGDQNIFISQNSPFKQDENSFQHNQTLPNFNDQQSTNQSPLQKNKVKHYDNQQIFEYSTEQNQVLLTEQFERLNNQQTQNKTNISQFNINNNQEYHQQKNQVNFSDNQQMFENNADRQQTQLTEQFEILNNQKTQNKTNISQFNINNNNQEYHQQKNQVNFSDNQQMFENNADRKQTLLADQFEILNNQQTQNMTNISQFNNNNQENQNQNIQKIDQMPSIERIYADPRSSQRNIQNKSFLQQNQQQQESQINNKFQNKVELNLNNTNLDRKQLNNLNQQVNQSDKMNQNLQNQQQNEQFGVQQVDENLFGTFSKNNNQIIQENHQISKSTASFTLIRQNNSNGFQANDAQQYVQKSNNQPQIIQINSNGFQTNQYQTPIKNMQQGLFDNNSNQIKNISQSYNIHSTPFTKDKQNNNQKSVSVEDQKMNTQESQFREAQDYRLNPNQQFDVGNKSFQQPQKQLFPLQEIIIAERDSVNHYYNYTDTEKHANQYQPTRETGSYVNQFQFMQQQQQQLYEKSFQFTNKKQQNQFNQTVDQNTSKQFVQNSNLNSMNQFNQQQNEIQFNISPQKDNYLTQNRGPIFIENQQPDIKIQHQNQAENQNNDKSQDQPYSTDRSLYFKRQKKTLNNIISSNTLSNNQQILSMDQSGQTIKLGKNQVEVSLIRGDNVSQEIFDKVLLSKKFKDWVEEFDTTGLTVKSIKIDYVFMFGPNVGFVILYADCVTQSHNIRLPGFIFMRGKAVCMLVIVNKKYMLLCKQYRVPAGKWLIEAPAGMIDESGHFSGVAAKELKEETGIDIDIKDLVDLGGFYPSPGGCDEELLMFAVEKDLSDEKLKEITSKIHGEHDEQITIEIQEYNMKNVIQTKDAKLMCLALAYNNFKENKQVQNSSL